MSGALPRAQVAGDAALRLHHLVSQRQQLAQLPGLGVVNGRQVDHCGAGSACMLCTAPGCTLG